MTRTPDASLSAEIQKPRLNLFAAFHLELPDPVYAWTGHGLLKFDNRDWLGVGNFGGFGSLEETTDGTAPETVVSLSGIDPAFNAYLVEQPYRNALCELWIGAVDDSWTRVVAGPRLYRRGRLRAVDVEDGSTLRISATFVNSSRDQTRNRPRRYTNEEQQRRHPGDKFFEYMAQMQSAQVLWGREG